jgi:sigma-B regulation protein RsbU (phosphoserine phosphatase)
MTYTMLNTETMRLAIVDAGHLTVVHAAKGRQTEFITATGGMAIGIMDGVEFTKHEVDIKDDDVFVLYTDGVTEARNIKKEEFGEEKLKEIVTQNKHLSAKEITERLYQDILTFRGRAPQHDDITIITLKGASNKQSST